jgi:streptomycin 6-kinase
VLPALADLTTPADHVDYVESMLADLSALVQSGAFLRVTEQSVATIARAATRITSPISEPAYLHGDLTAENVFVSDWTSYRGAFIIIDWQRPLRGPVDLDRACLLESLGVDPLPIVGPEIMALLAITRTHGSPRCRRRSARHLTYDAIASLARWMPGRMYRANPSFVLGVERLVHTGCDDPPDPVLEAAIRRGSGRLAC